MMQEPAAYCPAEPNEKTMLRQWRELTTPGCPGKIDFTPKALQGTPSKAAARIFERWLTLIPLCAFGQHFP
jgi:hypothetical protein